MKSILVRAGSALIIAVLALTAVGASSTPASAAFGRGERVQVANTGGLGLNVRYGPGLGYNIVTSASPGAVGRVLAGPVYSNGYTWYQITGFDSYGSYGWSAGEFLYSVGSGYQRAAPVQRAQPVRQAAPVRRVQPVRQAAPANGPTYNMLATAYNGAEFGSNGIMRNGNYVHWGAVAVDPNVIPLGTRMYISGYGNQVFVAEDTGSAIKGYRIDIWMPSLQQAREFGAQRRTVTIIR